VNYLTTWIQIGYGIYSLLIYNHTKYDYTLALVPSRIPLTELNCSEVFPDLTDSLVFVAFFIYHPAGPMETPAFLLLVAMQHNSTGVVSISMEVSNLQLPSNDRVFTLQLQSNDGI
jgi:hypothetical protein